MGLSKRARYVEDRAWLPPLSLPSVIGVALFIVYVGSALFSAVPQRPAGPAPLYTRAEELEYCSSKLPQLECLYSTSPASNRTIYVQPYGGLGNRLRAVASGLTVAKEVGANVVVVWADREHGFRGQWSDLFAAPRLPLGCFPGQALLADHAHCTVRKINHYTEWEAAKLQWEDAGNGKEVLCMQSMMFLTPKQRGIGWFYALLRPAEGIMAAVQAFKRRVQWDSWGQWVGVHIRRTDLHLKCNTDDCHDGVMALDVVPLSGYTQTLAQVAELSKSVREPRFFLATDDPATEAEVRQTLQATSANLTEAHGSVLSFGKAVRDAAGDSWAMRNDMHGTQEAVIDLWLLSQVHLLIGTVGSSYSQTARLMGDPFFVSVGVEYENKL